MEKFGRYEVIESLGKGATSAVLKAKDPLLNRFVAIKAIHPQLSQKPGFETRLQREVEALAKLDHPNIVDIYDAGTQQKTFYMVLEFVSGDTLKDRIEQSAKEDKTLPLEQVDDIITSLCSAIDFIHQAGLVHRDLKPANIMFNEEDNLMLTDFGIVKILGGESYTITRGLLGTPYYMSPEQCIAEAIDKRSDVYSIGVILFELCTGALPFGGKMLMNIVKGHVQQEPPKPHVVNPELPVQISEVILKALNKEPDDRYQSAGELAKDYIAARKATGADTPVPKKVADVPQPSVQNACLKSSSSGKVYALTREAENLIGRSKTDQSVNIDLTSEEGSEYVHSKHAILRFSDGRWELEQLKDTRNPIFVNDTKVEPGSKTELSLGDRIKFVEAEMILESDE